MVSGSSFTGDLEADKDLAALLRSLLVAAADSEESCSVLGATIGEGIVVVEQEPGSAASEGWESDLEVSIGSEG
jgi:hypothetical protein